MIIEVGFYFVYYYISISIGEKFESKKGYYSGRPVLEQGFTNEGDAKRNVADC